MAIGTTAALIGGAAATIGGSLIGASSAKKASKQQANAAKDSLALQRDIFETTEANQAPFIEGGTLALEALLFELGLGDAPTFGGTPEFTVGDRTFDTREAAETFLAQAQRPSSFTTEFRLVPDEREGGFKIVPTGETGARFGDGFDPTGLSVVDTSTPGTTFGGFQESPGFKFGFQQGVSAVDASAAAGGSLFSGATAEELTRFGQGFASQQRGTFLDRLAGIVGSGQNAVGQLGRSAATFGQDAASALGALGNARSAGTIGQANAFTSGLNSLATTAGSFLGGLGGGGGSQFAPQFSPIPVAKPSLAF